MNWININGAGTQRICKRRDKTGKERGFNWWRTDKNIGRAIIAKLGKEKQMYDQRILDSRNFVEGILKKTDSFLARKLGLSRSSISSLNRLGEMLIMGEEFRKIGLKKILWNAGE